MKMRFFDFEVFPHWWLCVFADYGDTKDNYKIVHSDMKNARDMLIALLKEDGVCVCGYNIKHYDLIIANEEEFKRNKESLFLEADEFMNELISAGKALLGVKYFSSSVNEVGNPIEIDVFNEFYSHKNSFELPYKRVSFYNKHFKNVGLLINEYLKNNYKIICCIDEEYQLKKLKEYLLDANIEFSEVNELNENIISNVIILHTNLYEGFENSLENIVFLSSNELFGIKHSKSRF